MSTHCRAAQLGLAALTAKCAGVSRSLFTEEAGWPASSRACGRQKGVVEAAEGAVCVVVGAPASHNLLVQPPLRPHALGIKARLQSPPTAHSHLDTKKPVAKRRPVQGGGTILALRPALGSSTRLQLHSSQQQQEESRWAASACNPIP